MNYNEQNYDYTHELTMYFEGDKFTLKALKEFLNDEFPFVNLYVKESWDKESGDAYFMAKPKLHKKVHEFYTKDCYSALPTLITIKWEKYYPSYSRKY